MNLKKIIITSLILILAIFSVTYFYLLFLIVQTKDLYNPIQSDAIVVLGHFVDSDTKEPSNWLTARLNTAITLFENGYADTIIVSGGAGQRDIYPTAIPMYNYLVNMGIPSDNIILEKNSNTTFQNFKYTRALANEHNINSIIISTNGFHMYRSMLLAAPFFNDITAAAYNTNMNLSMFFAYLREPISVIGNYFFNLILLSI